MAKKKRKPQRRVKVSKMYEAKGDSVSRKNKFCPKCGAGYFMAVHKDRVTCGKCQYTEMKKG